MGHAAQFVSIFQRIGRPMLLRRMTQAPLGKQIPLDVIVRGTSLNYRPQQLIGNVIQGDTQIKFCNKEIAAAQWPGPPKQNDVLSFDGRTTIIMAVEARYSGEELLEFVCQVRG